MPTINGIDFTQGLGDFGDTSYVLSRPQGNDLTFNVSDTLPSSCYPIDSRTFNFNLRFDKFRSYVFLTHGFYRLFSAADRYRFGNLRIGFNNFDLAIISPPSVGMYDLYVTLIFFIVTDGIDNGVLYYNVHYQYNAPVSFFSWQPPISLQRIKLPFDSWNFYIDNGILTLRHFILGFTITGVSGTNINVTGSGTLKVIRYKTLMLDAAAVFRTPYII